ncbi:MAG: molecular chaperone TorD family protein [Desulfuromonadales bacterium]|nr:molecular chaperone TorD family protein [Desulfuromonadales bacterium]
MLHIHQRLRLYQFFADLFANPGPELMQKLSGGEVSAVSDLLGIEAPLESGSEMSMENLSELYTGLFVARMGGVPAPLYGSVYLDAGLLMGPSTGRIAELYRQQGLVFEDATEPADFLATELEFLFFLVGREEAGFKQRDLAAARAATAGQLEFLNGELLPWLEQFVERLAKVEEKTLYHWGAQALLLFCRQERDWLSRLPQSPALVV